MSESRKKLLVSIGPLMGIALASLCWLYYISRPRPSGLTDADAHKIGFASAERYNQVSALSHGTSKLHDLTEDDFRLIEDVLAHDSMNAKALAISAFTPVKSHEQKRRALQLMKPYINMDDGQINPQVYMIMTKYRSQDKPVIQELANDPDAKVRALATKLLTEDQSQMNQSGAK